MLDVTLTTAIVSVVVGVVGGLLNSAYGYLKLNETLEAKTIVTRMIVGAVAGILLVHAILDTLNWYQVILTGITAGYFGVDVVDFLIKKPVPDGHLPPHEHPDQPK